MTETPIRGLLFDKDGTLFDFAATWAGVLDDTLAALTPDRELQLRMAHATGYRPEEKTFEPGSLSVAGALDVVAEVWAGHLPDIPASKVVVIADRIAESAVSSGALVPAVPDLAGYLHDLCRAGYHLGIATHDSEAAAIAHVADFGGRDHFTFIAGYDSGHGHKPGPGMLLAFAEATGLDPSEIAMIGDSVHDLGVAPAAGAALAIGVLTGPAEHHDLAPYADHVIPSIAELPGLLSGLGRAI